VKRAKLFRTGGSQAVRLPAQFRFPGDEVAIRRDPETGDVVLSPVASGWSDWKDLFDRLDELNVPEDFLVERDQPPAQERSGLS
jgi:antitoxin VapB